MKSDRVLAIKEERADKVKKLKTFTDTFDAALYTLIDLWNQVLPSVDTPSIIFSIDRYNENDETNYEEEEEEEEEESDEDIEVGGISEETTEVLEVIPEVSKKIKSEFPTIHNKIVVYLSSDEEEDNEKIVQKVKSRKRKPNSTVSKNIVKKIKI